MFLACVLVCALIFAAVLSTTPPGTPLAAGSQIGSILLAAPCRCALPPDGLICPHIAG